jgi:hypothetical protein
VAETFGGLNDTVQAATTQLLLGRQAQRSEQAGSTNPTRETNNGSGTSPLRCPREGLLPRQHGRKELIDHILVSAALVKPLDSVTTDKRLYLTT